MSEPRISVIIPAYNAAGWVARAIESALVQTRPPHEVIVVDDGSSDDTADVASAFGPRIQVVRQSNGGPASARNTGIHASTGDWIALLDADDTWLPRKLELQSLLMDDPKVGIIHARQTIKRGVAMPPHLSFELLWENNCIIASTVLLRRTCYDQVGGFDPDPNLIGVEDYNLWLRIADAGWVIAARMEWLARYTPTSQSLSRDSVRFMKAELVNLGKVATLLSLPESAVRVKRERILTYYATEFLYRRHIDEARNAYALLLGHGPNLAAVVGFGLTLLPRFVLDARRRWRAKADREEAEPYPAGIAARRAGTKPH